MSTQLTESLNRFSAGKMSKGNQYGNSANGH